MSLTFANPHAFWLLLLLPAFIVLKVLADARAVRAAGRVASPRLVDSLIVNEGRGRGWVVIAFELLALVFFASSLARPQYGVLREETPGVGRSLIIAMDTSKSMDANDLPPSRLARAQMAAEDLVKRLRGYRIGLMPFAGTSLMYAPITPDTDAVMDCIQDLDTDFIPRPGSNISRAIDLAISTFKRADMSGQQAMVIFSDGEELEGEAIAAAKRAKEANLAVICVGVGTLRGSPIEDPNAEGGFHRDRSGKPVMTRLEKDVLVKIADITGGLYLSLDSRGVSDARIDTILSKLQRSEMKTKVTETAVDRYRWPLVAGIGSLVIAFLCGIVRRYRGALSAAAPVAAVFLTLLASPPSAGAQDNLLPPAKSNGDRVTPPAEVPLDPNAAKKPSLRATPPSENPSLESRPKAAPKVRKPKPASSAKAETPEEKEVPEPAPVKGDPWRLYDLGDWRSSVHNFEGEIEAAVTLKRSPREIERLHMARGAAAFKGALRKPEKFDYHMINQAIESFGTALASDDPAIRESAHYNLANAIYERTRAADKLREENLKKAVEKKKKKDIKKFSVTIPYLDRTIRLLENSVEHYQETLVLNENNAAAKANYASVTALIKQLRDIRKDKVARGEGKKGEGQGQGQGEGEGEGQGKGKGKGKGKGQGSGSGSGEESDEGDGGDDEEMEEGDEGDEDGGEGDGGEGEEPGEGKGEGEGEGEGKGKGDETNKEFEGKAGTEGDTGEGEGGDKPGEGEGESENPDSNSDKGGGQPGSGGGSEEMARRRLRDLSQEIRDRIRPRGEMRERRPLKDW